MNDFRRWFIAAAALTLSTGLTSAQGPYLISTYAGGLPAPTSAAGTSYALRPPNGIATDHFGNTYVSTGSNCVFRLDIHGNLSRVAGSGEAGFSGDGGIAVSAQLNNPQGLAVDELGNLYIADQVNQRIRQVTPLGIITTVAGTGTPGYSGNNGPATAAKLSTPAGLAMDLAGNLYIADEANNVIRKINPAGTITTVAGTGGFGTGGDGGLAISATLSSPASVAVDAAGNLYIGDGSFQIRKVNTSGIITHIAGTANVEGYSGDLGLAVNAQLTYPAGLAVDTAGDVYIADKLNQLVRKINSSGIITTYAGGGATLGDGGPATNAFISSPLGVAVDFTNDVYILDTSDRVRVVNASNIINTVAGTGSLPASGDGGPAIFGQFNGTWGLAIDAASNLYVVDSGNYRVQKIPLTGGSAGVVSTFAGNGSNTDSGNGGQALSAGITPTVVAVFAGNVYLADTAQVRQIAPNGVISTVAGTGVGGYNGDNIQATAAMLSSYVTGLAVDPSGNLYVSDTSNNRVRKFTPGGIISTVAGTGTAGFSGDGPGTGVALDFPTGLAVDSTGTNLYIADNRNCRVRKLVLASGALSTIAGNGTCADTGNGAAAASAEITNPWGLALDAGGNLYIATQGNTVRAISSGGIISTIAGTGAAGYSGDGGPAATALVNYPVSIIADSTGNLYVSDFNNNTVRVLQPVGLKPLLTVSSAHNGVFTAGQANAVFTITATNAAQAATTTGTVTVTDTFPTSLTPVSMGGTGWSCSFASPTYTCTNTGSLAGGNNYGTLDLVVNVASGSGTPQVTNQVTVSGGGSLGTGSEDLAFVGSPTPILEITATHQGNFVAGEDETFTLSVANAPSAASTSGTVNVTDALPSGLSLISLAGTGWSCTGNSCTNTAALAGGAGYNPITGTVSVSPSAASYRAEVRSALVPSTQLSSLRISVATLPETQPPVSAMSRRSLTKPSA